MSDPMSILSLMKQDHHEIEALIDTLTDSLEGSYDIMRNHFERFEWKLEKHLFVEEKAIFTFYEPEDITQGFHMLPTIMKQHNFILNEPSKMRKSVNNGKTPAGLDELKVFLEKHRNYEEKDLYPKIQDALTIDQKRKVIERIKEMS